MDTTPGIHIDQLSVAYDGSLVIDQLSLTIERGTFFTLLGPSGCGKTTLLRTIAGFVPARAGRIQFGAQDVTAMPAHQRNIGMVFQDYALFPDKTVFDNVAYGLRARKQDPTTIQHKVGAALERVGLSGLAQRHPAALSGGQRQRVALARALVIEPQVLLMDEPLSNLDAKLRVQVRQTIAELQAEAGITTVFVTHDQDEALALSHRIGVMKQGRLEQVGTPEQIYRQPVSSYVADFVGAANVVPVQLAQALAAGAQTLVPLGTTPVLAQAPVALQAGPALLVARPETIDLRAAPAPLSEYAPATSTATAEVSLGSSNVQSTASGRSEYAPATSVGATEVPTGRPEAPNAPSGGSEYAPATSVGATEVSLGSSNVRPAASGGSKYAPATSPAATEVSLGSPNVRSAASGGSKYAPATSVGAIILHRQYLGDKTSYRVALPGGPELEINCHGSGHDAHAPGASVTLHFDPSATWVLGT